MNGLLSLKLSPHIMIIYALIIKPASNDDTTIENYQFIRLNQAVGGGVYSSLFNILKDMCVVYD